MPQYIVIYPIVTGCSARPNEFRSKNTIFYYAHDDDVYTRVCLLLTVEMWVVETFELLRTIFEWYK